ncbi:relaxase/mobilization nuclease domain-containing protein [Bengtsoniella intestinalis]|uniref:relaxase/mobilization nuclease domain-containing protein n=1 Tax=Bengtsoniella intestinalis TaxID=3073143 RepID=UPI00391F1795
MAVTKILARKSHPKVGVDYILNGDKTEHEVLTAYQNCDPTLAAQQMMDTKERYSKLGGVQYYHLIQSFKPDEITPELALEVAQTFAREHLGDFEVVMATHVDRDHIHSHLIFNSVAVGTGQKYHSNARTYYTQIRAISDRLCREHGLSVIENPAPQQSLSYAEWLRQSKGQPTFRSMLESDLKQAVEDAVDFGNFLMLMEHMGYEVKHGNRLGFRLRGQERYQYPCRRNPQFTEDGIRATIDGIGEAIASGVRPIVIPHPAYTPPKKHPRHRGFVALYYHYLYVLGKVEKQEYPKRLTPQTKVAIMEFERYREQFAFLRDHQITTSEEMKLFVSSTEKTLAKQVKHRTILNVQKKKKAKLFAALANVESLAPMDEDRHRQAVTLLAECGIPKEQLLQEKSNLYQEIATINRELRETRKTLKMCQQIEENIPRIKSELATIEPPQQSRKREQER